LAWFSGKYFPFSLGERHFLEIVENPKISFYLLIISSVVLNLLIAIYFVLNICFLQFHPIEFDFYTNFGPQSFDYDLFFSYHFLN